MSPSPRHLSWNVAIPLAWKCGVVTVSSLPPQPAIILIAPFRHAHWECASNPTESTTQSSCRPCWDFLLLPHLRPRPLSSLSACLFLSLSLSYTLFLSLPLFLPSSRLSQPPPGTRNQHMLLTPVVCLGLSNSLRNLT